MAESEEELKSLLIKMKEESEKAGLKLNIQKKIKIKTMETVSDFIFGGSKITADGDCSHEIKRCLLLGRKAMTNVDNILKSRDITLPTKVCTSTRFEARFPYHASGAMTRSPSPLAWRPDFPGAPREAH